MPGIDEDGFGRNMRSVILRSEVRHKLPVIKRPAGNRGRPTAVRVAR
jgi:hypothetical protein